MSLTSQLVHKTATIEKRLEGMNRSEIQRRNQHAWSHACSTFLALPGLRGFWPMSAFSATGAAYDQSGNGRTLTYNGNPTYNYDGLAPYIDLDRTVPDYLSRADEAGLDILGTEAYVAVPGLTLGGWFYFDDVTNDQFLIGKYGGAGSRAYRLILFGSVANDPIRFYISTDGVANTEFVSLDGGTISAWQFVVGRFNDADAGEELKIWRNNITNTATTLVGSIFNAPSSFTIGANSAAGNPFDGRASMCFLCAAALSDNIIAALYAQTRALFGV